ncbi:MAG: cytochrome c [Gemmatimonadota bacterium]|nr:cytochrome c [Gemmatimonadota bacterium]
MRKSKVAAMAGALCTVLLFAACGGDGGEAGADARPAGDDGPAGAEAGDAAAIAARIGPVTEIELGPIQAELAERGEAVFTSKCSACHKLDERYVGPALRDVAERRPPVYVMNMILNPEQMVREHPEVKALLAQYYTPMPNQNLTDDEARAVLEYLRHAAAEGAEAGEDDGDEGEVEE